LQTLELPELRFLILGADNIGIIDQVIEDKEKQVKNS